METIGVAVALGVLMGLRHALDPDHVAAISTWVSQVARRRPGPGSGGAGSWFLGAWWGIGHSLTIFLVGGAIILLKLAIPPGVQAGMEFAVGAMLVFLGTLNLTGRGQWGIHEHSHEHGWASVHHHHIREPDSDGAHTHAHSHNPSLEGLASHMTKAPVGRAFWVGVVHGLAGSSAVALLVLAAFPSPPAAMAYLMVFGLGTLAGMAALSALLELAMGWMARRWAQGRWLTAGAGAVSVGLGLYIMLHTAGALR